MKHKAFILIIFFIVSLFMSVTTNTLESAYKNIAEMNVLQNKNSISFEILGAKSISGTNFITALDAGDDIIIQKNGLILGPYYGKAIYLKSGHSLQVPLISGRFVTSQDMGQGQKVAVIGKNLEYLTFMENDQEYIRYDDEDYNVIGKLGHSNRSSSFDDLFILNLDQLLLKSDNLQYYSDLWTIYNLNSSTEESFYHLNNQIKNINNQTSLTQLNTQTSNSYLEELLTNRLFSLSITGVIIILLLMNILNTTNFYIESKRREIGIRKAVGASNWNISVKILKDYISLAIVAYLIAQIVYIGVVRFKITPLIFGDSINLFSTTAGFVLVLVVGCLVAVVPVVQSIRLQPNEIIKGADNVRNITFAIHSLSRRVGFMIIAVLQISVSLILLYSSIQINEGLNRSNNTVVNYFDKREIYTLSNNEEYQKDLFNDVKPISYEKFNNYLKTSTDFVHISYQGDRLMVKDFRNSDDFVMTTQYFLEDQGNKYVAANALIIEANYIKYFPLKVSEGRSFSETDFTHNNEEQTVPVLLGGNYKYLFSIGDIWEHKNEQTGVISKLKIIGFLESNQFFTDAKLPLNNIKNLENYIVFPKNEIRLNISNDDKVQKQQNINYKLNLYNHIMHSMVLITQEERHKQIIQEITETSREMGFYDIRGINAMNQLEKHKKLYQEQTTIINALFVIIIVISSIGIVSNMLYSIMKRYNEFGIHILTGASIFDIVSRIIYEVLVLIIISLILTYAGITLVSGSGFIHFEIATFIQLCGMAIVLGLLIAVIPTIYILKVQANRLLRRIQ